LRLAPPASKEKTTWPRSRFIARYLVALAVWILATGAFNPFVNVYLTRIWQIQVASIGRISAWSHAMQVLGMLGAPVLLRKLGAARGIALTQVAAAGVLGLLGVASGSTVAAVLYVGFMGFQYAGEPGMFHLLMSGVDQRERNGASAMHFLTTSIMGSIASLAGGAAIGKLGYGPVLGLAALLAAIAALLFGFGIPASGTRPRDSAQVG
jgi:predicted MFS family arabinose efflux permease